MAAYAAIERKRKRRLDEEAMTRYSEADLEKGWEFKIMRSATGSFTNPQVLQSVVQQESLGSWDLLEKFDDGRLRFRRPVAARNNDGNLPRGYDPYRAQVGISEGALVMYVLIGLAVLVGGIIGILAWAGLV
ncbi:MAG: hypothetical protein WEA61_02900 [Anaerolineales bacterium]